MNLPVPPLRAALAPFACALLLLAGCDAAGDEPAFTADAQAAAIAIANALGSDGGGLLDDAADAAALVGLAAGAVEADANPGRTGCTRGRAYDTASGTWTSTFACTRGSQGGDAFAAFGRTVTHRFLRADGQPQPRPAGAATLHYAITDATGVRRTPALSHTLTGLASALTVSDLGQALVTVNGTYTRAATDTLRAPSGAQRTLAHRLDLALRDVRGPRGEGGEWTRAVSGTIEGVYRATHTHTATDGQTRTHEVDRPFTVTFAEGEAAGQRVARIALGREVFLGNLRTGELMGRGRR